MSSRPSMNRTIVSVFCLILFSWISQAQTYPFKNWQGSDGLPGTNVVYTLNQDNNGFLWIGTTDGIFRFDGFDFHRAAINGQVKSGRPTCSFRDSSGVLWFGFDNGSVSMAGKGILREIFPSDSSSVSAILQDQGGQVYAVLQHGVVIRIDRENPAGSLRYRTGFDEVSSAAIGSKGEFLFGARGKIAVCRIERQTMTTLYTLDSFDYERVTAIHPLNKTTRLVVGTEWSGLFLLNLDGERSTVSRFKNNPGLESLAVKSIADDTEGSILVATDDNGIARIYPDKSDSSRYRVDFLNTSSGLAGDKTISAFRDMEGNIWVGHNGKGLSMLGSEAFTFYSPGRGKGPDNIIYINKLRDAYFLGTPSGYYTFDPETGKAGPFTSLSAVIGRSEIIAYHIDRDRNIWFGTNGNGLYFKRADGNAGLFYRTGDSGADYINDIDTDAANLWIASRGGVSILGLSTGTLRRHFDMSNGLPHNFVNKVLVTGVGEAYIAAQSRSFEKLDLKSGVVSSRAEMSGNMLNKVLALDMDKKGVVWAATEGNGLFGWDGDSIVSVTTSSGLMNDYIHSIMSDSEGMLWLGHDRGFTMYNPETGMARVFGADFTNGGKCNPGAMYESPGGLILIGTTEGLTIYDRQREKQGVRPAICNILSIQIGDSLYSYQPFIKLPYKKRYPVTVRYIGINLTDPGKVYYSTYLHDLDQDWSEYNTRREVQYSLGDGKYSFNLVSVNEDDLKQESSLAFEIIIKPPLWRRWWFLLGAFVTLAGVVVLIIRQRDKAHIAREKELERQVAERTEDVKRQKVEIERQNTEITDSINYAKRIQTNILPDIARLKEAFSDAFILYHPRDIVSGDFYWFDRISEEKIVIVCADSTGHGVPGAFMSMIGSTLLHDIVKRQSITSPSKILSRLDSQIFAMLNQNSGAEVSNDGMDMVVCEYNLLTRHLRFASAMRPVILIMEGESHYIKGNRLSVGGESAGDKFFVDQEYFLKEGDVIYLFTDGISDQFGGPGGADGKKMKINRLKRFIDELSILPASEQKVELSKFFYDWKGEHEQVDDVLFMGLKV